MFTFELDWERLHPLLEIYLTSVQLSLGNEHLPPSLPWNPQGMN